MSEEIARLKIDRSGAGHITPKAGKRRILIVSLVAVAILVSAVAVYKSRVVEIETATVTLQYPSSSFTLLNASGYVVAQRKAALAAKATGRLEWLGVEEGSHVRNGDVIARLEGLDSEAQQQQARASVNSAAANRDQADVELKDAVRSLKRARDLLSQGVVSQAEYDSAEARENRARAALAASTANLAVAKAALSGADVSVGYTKIRAPFDGVVLTKNADVGDIVTPLGAAANAKASVVTIADLDSLRVEVDVSESSLEKVRIGQSCEILLDSLPQNRFKGAVHSIVPTADRSKATVMVKVSFIDRDKRILPEMSAKVAFLEREVKGEEQQPRMMLPKNALLERNGKKVAYLVVDDRLKEINVDLIGANGDLVEVKGLKVGDKVAVKPLDKLSAGLKVKVAQK